MNTRSAPFPSPAAGFTMVELLVSSAVLAIVLAIMFAALSTGMSLWRNTDNKIVADREARAVESLLVRDLRNMVMPASTNLWPRVSNSVSTVAGESSTDFFLKFLTLAPGDAQSAIGGEIGDVCYVEYAVVRSTNGPGRELRRFLMPSSQTYSNIIRSNSFPTNVLAGTNFQSLGLYLLPANKMAARGRGSFSQAVNDTNFLLLGTNMLPFVGVPSANNYPVAVEVNFAVADPVTLANTSQLNDTNYIARAAGLYSFRIPLPRPQTSTP
jgi:prepilin-type N-terminal cleavage/methylation domain-containing protein